MDSQEIKKILTVRSWKNAQRSRTHRFFFVPAFADCHSLLHDFSLSTESQSICIFLGWLSSASCSIEEAFRYSLQSLFKE